MPSPRRTAVRRLLAAVLGALVLTSSGLIDPSPAHATYTLGQRAVYEAAKHKGKPYQYGAVGPYRFDCSGFTLYVFGRLGRKLPHSSAQQYNAPGVRHIAKSSKLVGDLVFMRNSSYRITHVGIYAGSNRWWVAPKTGDVVKLQTLYSTNYVVGRVT
jgi:peptidoglycan DL-endopeptidase CwlO